MAESRPSPGKSDRTNFVGRRRELAELLEALEGGAYSSAIFF